MMNFSLLESRQGSVLILTINELDRSSLAQLHVTLPVTLENAMRNPNVGAIVLTATEHRFCSSVDFGESAIQCDNSVSERNPKIDELPGVIRAIRESRKPVIAAVEGVASGAWMTIALTCDLVVVARDSRFSVSYVRAGITPDSGVATFLSAFLSRQMLRETCLTNDYVAGVRMLELGAVNRVAEPGRALEDAVDLGARVSACTNRVISRG